MALQLLWGCDKLLTNEALGAGIGTVGSPELSTTRVRLNGTKSIKFDSSAAIENIQLSKWAASGAIASFTETTLYVTFWVNFDVLAAGDLEICSYGSRDTTDFIAKVVVEADGDVVLLNEAATKSSVAGNVSDDGSWHRIDVKFVESGTCELQVDLGTAVTLTGSAATQSRLVFGCLNSTTATWYLDDVVVSDSAFPGTYEICTLVPNAVGSFTSGWNATGTTGSGGYPELDDDETDGDTTIVVAANATNDLSANLSALPSGRLPQALQSVVYGRDNAGGFTSAIVSYLYDGVTKSSSSGANMGTVYAAYAKLIETDPSGGALTISDANSLQVGASHVAAVTATPQVSTIWAEVLTVFGSELAGHAFAFTQGVLSDQIQKAIAGQAFSFAQGNVSDQIQKAITGQAFAFAQGNVSDRIQTTLTGQAFSFVQGDFAAVLAGVTLLGQSYAFTQGAVSDRIQIVQTGQAFSFAQGNFSAVLAGQVEELTGQVLSFAQGNLTDTIQQVLTGQAFSFAQGALPAHGQGILTGQAFGFAQGALSDTIQLVLAGQAFSFAQGAVVDRIQRALVGQAFHFGQGLIDPLTDQIRFDNAVAAKCDHDFVARGILKLAPPYYGKPRATAILLTVLEEIQELECAISSVIVGRYRDVAMGRQLRVLGKLLGVPWQGWTDSVYRTLIDAQISVNSSRGLINDVIRTVAALWPDAVRKPYWLNDACVAVEVVGPAAVEFPAQLRLLNQTVAAGTRFDLWMLPAAGGLRADHAGGTISGIGTLGYSGDANIGDAAWHVEKVA